MVTKYEDLLRLIEKYGKNANLNEILNKEKENNK